jgi:hypothetical protein
MLPLLNEPYRYRSKSLLHVPSKCIKGVIPVFTKIPFDCTPEILNEVHFAIILWQEDTHVDWSVNQSMEVGRKEI